MHVHLYYLISWLHHRNISYINTILFVTYSTLLLKSNLKTKKNITILLTICRPASAQSVQRLPSATARRQHRTLSICLFSSLLSLILTNVPFLTNPSTWSSARERKTQIEHTTNHTSRC